MDSSEVSS